MHPPEGRSLNRGVWEGGASLQHMGMGCPSKGSRCAAPGDMEVWGRAPVLSLTV